MSINTLGNWSTAKKERKGSDPLTGLDFGAEATRVAVSESTKLPEK